jgi:hypothetical protein
MLLGLTPFTWFHTLISLVAIVAGIVVVKALLESRTPSGWTGVFLATAVATSVTGFGFKASFGPSHAVGVIALVVLVPALLAIYVYHLRGAWRWVYAATAVTSLYFLVFVLIAQFFSKVPALHALAPTQSEPPFAIAQAIGLIVFLALGFQAVRRYHPAGAQA